VLRRVLLSLCLLALPVTGYAFPDTASLDTFTGCTDTTSPPNANWTNALLDGGFNEGTRCDNAGVTSVTTDGNASSYYNVATYNADMEAWAVFHATDLNSNTIAVLAVRLTTIGASTSDGYIVVANNGDNTLKLYRLDNGSGTQIGSGVSQAIAVSDAFGIKASGTSICSWYKTAAGSWTEKECAVDATYNSAGGRIVLGVLAAQNDSGQITEVGGGNLAVASTRRPSQPIWLGD
jgi:hypothetical protein